MVQSLPITEAGLKLEALVRRLRLNRGYLILEKDGVALAGIMDIDKFEDYLELQDETVKRHIQTSSQEFQSGKSRPARELLTDLRAGNQKQNGKRRRKSKA